jgi:hypothetical protein
MVDVLIRKYSLCPCFFIFEVLNELMIFFIIIFISRHFRTMFCFVSSVRNNIAKLYLYYRKENSLLHEKSQLFFTSQCYQAIVNIYKIAHTFCQFYSLGHIYNALLQLRKQWNVDDREISLQQCLILISSVHDSHILTVAWIYKVNTNASVSNREISDYYAYRCH